MTQKQLTRNNIILMSCLLAFIIFLPAISAQRRILGSMLSSILIISSIFALDFPRRTRNILLGLGGIALILVWMDDFLDQDIFKLMDYFYSFFYLVFITATMIIHIARSARVTAPPP